jgi:mercuric ion transport protein
MKIEVLYIADCPNHQQVVERVQEVLSSAGIHDTVAQVEVRDTAEAEKWRFIGSPTVRIDGVDIEPEARTVRHFGLGCRSYAEDGRRSGSPSAQLIWRALQESQGKQAEGLPALSASPVPTPGKPKGTESGVLAVGGIAAVLASTCCLGPLILVALGFSGAWIGNLARLEPYRPWFIGAALVALFFAGRRIFRKTESCAPGEVCALPQTRRAYKLIFGIVSVLVIVALAFPYVARLFY